MNDDLTPFDFHLPQSHIATEPARPRDRARLLHVIPSQKKGTHQEGDHKERGKAQLIAKYISDLPDLLKEGDLLIANNTEVIRAQLKAKRGDAHISITLDRILPSGAWHALARNARKLRAHDILTFPDNDVTAEILSNEGNGAINLRFSVEGDAFDSFLERCGALALPPYIHRPTGPTQQDDLDYRTIFSQYRGAVAAPTAGLHFTESLLKKIKEKNIEQRTVTLHVGAGTFLPIRTSIAEHKMHAEWGHLDQETADAINQTRKRNGRIIAIGTTTLRLLESAAQEDGHMKEWSGETSIFIKPGYKFRVVDALMTNFHLPRSTLFMLVSAFSGTETMQQAYHYAISEGMRFYSYGDACFLERDL